MYWLMLILPLGVLAWAAWPRPVDGGRGTGPDSGGGEPPRPHGDALRVATFNIHGGKGSDGRRDLGRTSATLSGIDIAALQEVHDTWGSPRQAARLAAELDMSVLSAPTRRRWLRPHRGNALLSRVPIGEWRRVTLERAGGRGFHFRNLTIARLKAPRPLWVLFTHLNRGEGQEAQLDQVMREFLDHSPAVLMGDFNMRKDHPALKAHLEDGEIEDPLATHLDNDPAERIDWILCRGVNVKRAGCVDSGASDHPLYWCEIEA